MPVWVVCHGLWLGGSGGFPGGACGCNLYGGGGGAGLRLIWLPCRPGTERRKRGMFLAARQHKTGENKKIQLYILLHNHLHAGHIFAECQERRRHILKRVISCGTDTLYLRVENGEEKKIWKLSNLNKYC